MTTRRPWLAVAAVALAAAGALAAESPADPAAATRAAMRALCTELSQPCNTCAGRRAAAPGPPPTARPADDPLRKPVDGWGRRLQISVGGAGLTLRSPGADGALHSADDIVEQCSPAP